MQQDSLEKEKQIEILKNFIKSNPESREMRRALAVQLGLEGYVYRVIQNILSVSVGFISKWRTAFKAGGLAALKLGYQGAKSYLSQRERQEVIDWLIEQKTWDISELEVYLIEEYDLVFKSRQSYYQLLKEARITWQKAEQINPRQDQELISKKTEKLPKCLSRIEER